MFRSREKPGEALWCRHLWPSADDLPSCRITVSANAARRPIEARLTFKESLGWQESSSSRADSGVSSRTPRRVCSSMPLAS